MPSNDKIRELVIVIFFSLVGAGIFYYFYNVYNFNFHYDEGVDTERESEIDALGPFGDGNDISDIRRSAYGGPDPPRTLHNRVMQSMFRRNQYLPLKFLDAVPVRFNGGRRKRKTARSRKRK